MNLGADQEMASLLNPVGFASPKCDIIRSAAIVDCIGVANVQKNPMHSRTVALFFFLMKLFFCLLILFRVLD